MVGKPLTWLVSLLLGVLLAGCGGGSGGGDGGVTSTTPPVVEGFQIFDDPDARTTMTPDDQYLTAGLTQADVALGRSDQECPDEYIPDESLFWEFNGTSVRHVGDKCTAYGAGDPLINHETGHPLTISTFAVLEPRHIIRALGNNGFPEYPPDLQWAFAGILGVCMIYDAGDGSIAYANSAVSCVPWQPGEYVDHDDGTGREVIGVFVRWIAFNGHHTIEGPYAYQRQAHPRSIRIPGAADVCQQYPGLDTGWNFHQNATCELDGGVISSGFDIDSQTGGTIGDSTHYTDEGVPYCRVKDLGSDATITNYFSWNVDLLAGCVIVNSPHDPHGDGSYNGPQNTGNNGGGQNPQPDPEPDSDACSVLRPGQDTVQDVDGNNYADGSPGCRIDGQTVVNPSNGGNGGGQNPQPDPEPDSDACSVLRPGQDTVQDVDGNNYADGSPGCRIDGQTVVNPSNGGNGGGQNPQPDPEPDSDACSVLRPGQDTVQDVDGNNYADGSPGCRIDGQTVVNPSNGGNGGGQNPQPDPEPDSDACSVLRPGQDTVQDVDGNNYADGSPGCRIDGQTVVNPSNGGNGGGQNPQPDPEPDSDACSVLRPGQDTVQDVDGNNYADGSPGCRIDGQTVVNPSNGGNGGGQNPQPDPEPDSDACSVLRPGQDTVQDVDGNNYADGSPGCRIDGQTVVNPSNGGNGGGQNPQPDPEPDSDACSVLRPGQDTVQDVDGNNYADGSPGCRIDGQTVVNPSNGGNGGGQNPQPDPEPDSDACSVLRPGQDTVQDVDGNNYADGSPGCRIDGQTVVNPSNGGNGGGQNPQPDPEPDSDACSVLRPGQDTVQDVDGNNYADGSPGCRIDGQTVVNPSNGGNGGGQNPQPDPEPDSDACSVLRPGQDTVQDVDGNNYADGSPGCRIDGQTVVNPSNGGNTGSDLSHDEAKLCINKGFPSGTFIEDRNGDGWSDNVEPGCKLPEGQSTMTISFLGDVANDDYFFGSQMRLVG